ncbi:hypothetical protein HYV50_02200 [Candidatus Pacearchaeota archaeon]|nr:hypothetical protein [Candidatus Pacearchaeota archaeon]
MLNKLGKAYEAFDNAVMKGVNSAMRAYNWTTGDTKTDLANKLLTIAPVLESIGFFNCSPVFGLTVTPIYVFGSYIGTKNNKAIEDRESRALENNCLDYLAENTKRSLRLFCGPMFALLGASWAMPSDAKGYFTEDKTLTNLLTAIGFFARAASCYVMSADNLPPRKNCVKRGIEKLEQLISSYRTQPGTVLA